MSLLRGHAILKGLFRLLRKYADGMNVCWLGREAGAGWQPTLFSTHLLPAFHHTWWGFFPTFFCFEDKRTPKQQNKVFFLPLNHKHLTTSHLSTSKKSTLDFLEVTGCLIYIIVLLLLCCVVEVRLSTILRLLGDSCGI